MFSCRRVFFVAALAVLAGSAAMAQDIDMQRAIAERDAWQERAAWSRRMYKLGYVSKIQADADQAKLDGTELALRKLLAAQGKDGWVDLLAGGDLTKNWTTAGNWKLDKDGVVSLEPRKGESGWTRYGSYLWAKKQYKDFECDFEYKVAKSGNSGFYFHVGDVKSPVATGIEVQIYDSFGRPANAKLNDHDSGGIIPGIPPTKNMAKAAGEWNRMQVTVKGNKVTVKLNGEVVNEAQLDQKGLKTRPPTGAIGFQDHGMPLWFRNIKIREL